MTNLYAWNTARAGSIAHPNVVGRAYSTLQGRADFLACSTNLSPNKKMRPVGTDYAKSKATFWRCIRLKCGEKMSHNISRFRKQGK
uniref:Uncharacterized protein n=2 Tax=Candidatus Kentrum sp. FM TaxID=2126340 RepID=A0A450SQL9_9GAMM|nr:MAG: hypothetical protein BECKFM1743C_GA0114222_101182 [Candidatus Kentron sp. FM]VFJ56336.1 MAG: hypothetical protein BECKFM1743A_GA0114220_101662 [Candidatus Kentron sp. FM]VFK11176.1 MAG: hypothetical protein BECKFM1743B_GA0114221_101702 [Candidatus Kentron sp. FM]